MAIPDEHWGQLSYVRNLFRIGVRLGEELGSVSVEAAAYLHTSCPKCGAHPRNFCTFGWWVFKFHRPLLGNCPARNAQIRLMCWGVDANSPYEPPTEVT